MESVWRIPLTKGQSTIIDESDYAHLSQWKWHAIWSPSTQSYYAQRSSPRDENGRQEIIPMHRYLLGLRKGDKRLADHANHDTLDNRRSNLRIATAKQNAQNRRKSRTSRSEYKGICKNYGQWVAYITEDGKTQALGRFSTPDAAAECYRKASAERFGEFARSV